FHLNSGLDIQQQPFVPEKAWTYELGMKKSAFDDRLVSSWSIFQIKKQNVLTTNPVDSSYMITAAEESSRGIEWDFTAQPIDALNLKLAYAYIDAKVSKTEAASGIQKGSALLNSPKHNASLMMMYDLWQSGGQKGAVGSNIQYLSKRSGNVYDNGFNLPAYTLVHLNVAYQV
ncbi:TonB-dependent receptor domain-containing protein, partial [Acinetobacter junii]|uniref:TonB-dependent receptor domain-containing protein n=1 Tax=Acinetobacter junii TaxID=40215 RepID=UPI00125F5899